MFQSRLKDCVQDDWIFLKFEQQQRWVMSNTSGRVRYNQWKFCIGSIWSSGGSRSVLRLPGRCCSGSLSSRWHTSYFLCCTWMHHWTFVASHTNLNMASIVPNHAHMKWRHFFLWTDIASHLMCDFKCKNRNRHFNSYFLYVWGTLWTNKNNNPKINCLVQKYVIWTSAVISLMLCVHHCVNSYVFKRDVVISRVKGHLEYLDLQVTLGPV